MRTLIAYFSRAGENYFGGSIKNITVGNTEICARLIKEFLDADLFKIEMKQPYSDQYRECVEQAKVDFAGSGMGKSEETIKALCPDADVRKGKSIMGGQAKSSKTELEAWVKQNI